MSKKQLKVKVVNYFKSLSKSPTDKEVHSWAEKNGFDVHEVEEIIYKTAFEALNPERQDKKNKVIVDELIKASREGIPVKDFLSKNI